MMQRKYEKGQNVQFIDFGDSIQLYRGGGGAISTSNNFLPFHIACEFEHFSKSRQLIHPSVCPSVCHKNLTWLISSDVFMIDH